MTTTMTGGLTILSNSFHATEYRTRKTREELDAIDYRVGQDTATPAEVALLRKIRTALCGIEGCKCSGSTGER